MQRFKYIMSEDKNSHQETWVCEPCKKEKAEEILLGRWRLIDKCDGPAAPTCELCGRGEGETLAFSKSANC